MKNLHKHISDYLTEAATLLKAGKATEHSFRPALQRLLENITSGYQIINEPKRIACGAPDFVVQQSDIPVGYIEAKDLGVDISKNTEQFTRYKKSLNNLIITDNLDFNLYENGEPIAAVMLARLVDGKLLPQKQNFDAFLALIDRFTGYKGQTVKSAERLSRLMADKAKLLAETIEKAVENGSDSLNEQMQGIKQILIHDIAVKDFADIYAQTIAYGMFAARLNDTTPDTFSRREAAELIPKSNPFLRKMFQYVAGYDLDSSVAWIVDDLANLFRATDVDAIMQTFGEATKQNDPLIHFYETFLAEYDPALRKSRGVWYTPQPVVDFIVRAVDDILKADFNLAKGLADTSKVKVERAIEQSKDKRYADNKKKETVEVHKVQLLDPAAGTGTFLSQVVRHIHQSMKSQQGMWSSYVDQHLIPRLNGFEILMASYAMAHLKLELLLRETGYNPDTDKRLNVYLTNSLEEDHPDVGTIFAQWLSNEANAASRIKRETPVMVMLGNPPYSGHSSNNGTWIVNLLNDYKKEPTGGKLQERNPKWINDDYVKFIRLGQHFIEKNSEGVLAYINNHSFIDNPTFRGMRYNLLQTFDTIYILDLHGNAKKKEVAPDGGKDENVFDIQQGVSINIFVKTGRKKKGELAQVLQADLYGIRDAKYDYLSASTLSTVSWQQVQLQAPQYFFVVKDFENQKQYDKGFSVNELFPINSVGVVTAKDSILINSELSSLKQNVKQINSNHFDDNNVKIVAYRPFDNQYIYYDTKLIERSREKVMQHFLKGENLGLTIGRQGQVVGSMLWNLVYISNNITDFNLYYRGGGVLFPLYLYPDSEELFSISERTPNLKPELVEKIAKKIKLRYVSEQTGEAGTFAPIDILDYIYAVLHSPAYREKYKEFLKIDFPRVPYPTNVEQFWQLVALGGRLRKLHLLQEVQLTDGLAAFPIAGSNEVDKISYTDERMYINAEQYFDGVTPIVANFYIGGYQPAQKWLKDRRGRTLNFDDIEHYQRMCNALAQTAEIMSEIDKI